MLLANTVKSFGDLRCTTYDFEVTGDVLPMHTHDESTAHITIVTRGKIKAYADGWEREAVAGQILDFNADQPHELMALENETRVVNIVKKLGI